MISRPPAESRRKLGLIALILAAVLAPRSGVAEEPSISDWFESYNNKARLVAGSDSGSGHKLIYAGIEIAMPEGWKTYWRTPGDGGGVPPEFDWKASENVAEVRMLYPAPRRLSDKSGDVVGYKDQALFPALIIAKDPSQPVKLHLIANYGICKQLCIPAEVTLSLVVPPSVASFAPLSAAVSTVPGKPRPDIDPKLTAWRIESADGKQQLVLEVASRSPGDADAFVDADGGLYVPLPKRIAADGDNLTFTVDLSDGVNIKDLKGKPLKVTLVDGKGQSETTIKLE